MRVQIVSGLRLGEGRPPTPDASAPTLIIAGELGAPRHLSVSTFLAHCSHTWETVLLVPGASENCGGMTIGQARLLLSQIVTKYPNVHLLDSSSFVLQGVRFVGATLWAALPDPVQMLELHDIRTSDAYMELADVQRLHSAALDFLYRSAVDSEEPVVIVTAFPPGDTFTDCLHVTHSFETRTVDAWIYGRADMIVDAEIRGVRVIGCPPLRTCVYDLRLSE